MADQQAQPLPAGRDPAAISWRNQMMSVSARKVAIAAVLGIVGCASKEGIELRSKLATIGSSDGGPPVGPEVGPALEGGPPPPPQAFFNDTDNGFDPETPGTVRQWPNAGCGGALVNSFPDACRPGGNPFLPGGDLEEHFTINNAWNMTNTCENSRGWLQFNCWQYCVASGKVWGDCKSVLAGDFCECKNEAGIDSDGDAPMTAGCVSVYSNRACGQFTQDRPDECGWQHDLPATWLIEKLTWDDWGNLVAAPNCGTQVGYRRPMYDCVDFCPANTVASCQLQNVNCPSGNAVQAAKCVCTPLA